MGENAYICSPFFIDALKTYFLHIALIALVGMAILPWTYTAAADKASVRSIADTIRSQSGGRVTFTFDDGVESLIEIDSVGQAMPGTRLRDDAVDSDTPTTEHRTAVHKAGYRIQVYSDNNQRTAKSRAKQIAANINAKFPHMGTYLTYKAPYWRLRVGDYTTHETARSAMSELKARFPSLAGDMRIVRDRVKVYE